MLYNTGFNLYNSTGLSGGNTFSYGNPDATYNLLNGENSTKRCLQSGQYLDPSTTNNEWYLQPPEDGGTSQPYTGVEVIEGLSNSSSSSMTDLTTAPSSVCQGNHVSPNEGHYLPFHAGIRNSQSPSVPPFNVSAPSFAATLSWPYDTTSHAVPSAVTANTLMLPHTITNSPEGPGSNPYAAGPSTQPAVHTLPYIPPEEVYGCRSRVIPDPDPFGPSTLAPTNNSPGTTLPGSCLPPPVSSSSGPQRTSKRAKGKKKYNPVKSSKQAGIEEDEDDWDMALVCFETRLSKIIFNGRLHEAVSPETVLAAEITKTVKDELKRSPLQATKAGEGKRPRDFEDYLAAILRKIIPGAVPEGGGSGETCAKAAFYTNVARMLEATLLPVNVNSALRQPPSNSSSQTGKGARLEQTEARVKKNQMEKARRDDERSQLERISYLFKVAEPRQCWTRTELLSFVVVFLLYGPDVFSPGFVSDMFV